MRIGFRVSVCVLVVAASCRSGVPLPPADAIVEGRTAGVAPVDTIDDVQTIGCSTSVAVRDAESGRTG
jgi:hypothetical protein